MGHYYQDLDAPHFDYDLQMFDGLGTKKYRGPAIDPSKPYIVCIGAAQTYGRFIDDPFPNKLSRELGIQVMNLGVGGAGPQHFLGSGYLKWLNCADLVIVQMLSGRSAGNSMFDNSDSGGLLGIRRSDRKEMRFEEFLEDTFLTEDVETKKRIVEETRNSFVSSFNDLLESITAPRVLLWFSDRQPDYEDDFSSVWSVLNRYPQMVNRRMLEMIRPHCDAVVECVTDEGVPQKLWPSDENIDGAVSKDGVLYNQYYPSPEMNVLAAEMLVPVCRRFIPTAPAAASVDRPQRFVVLGAERTGSNLLVGLLESHWKCFMSGEVLNDFYVNSDEVPWISNADDMHSMDAELSVVRAKNPVQFIERLYEVAREPATIATGFKLMYGQAESYPDVRDYLIGDPDVRVVHLRRRNLLRRFVSERQAAAADVWAQASDANDPRPPAISLSITDCVWDFMDKESNAAKYDDLLKDTDRLLVVFYEDLAANPQLVASRVLAFLGLPAKDDLDIRYKKTGSEDLREVVTNYDEVMARISNWATMFKL